VGTVHFQPHSLRHAYAVSVSLVQASGAITYATRSIQVTAAARALCSFRSLMRPLDRPRLVIAGGPNGAGKTTFSRRLVAEHGVHYLGADEVAAELGLVAR
jgi:2-phosphoglycerate kinase